MIRHPPTSAKLHRQTSLSRSTVAVRESCPQLLHRNSRIDFVDRSLGMLLVIGVGNTFLPPATNRRRTDSRYTRFDHTLHHPLPLSVCGTCKESQSGAFGVAQVDKSWYCLSHLVGAACPPPGLCSMCSATSVITNSVITRSSSRDKRRPDT